MAAKKEHKIVSADTGKEVSKEEAVKNAGGKKLKESTAKGGSTTGLRIGAVACWIVAIVFEVLGVLILNGKIGINSIPTMWQLIGVIVLDLACVIVGAQLWKKANHIHPASEANKVKFWLWNNMGVIACVIAFVPFIILLLLNKDLDKKTKAIAVVVAVIALLIGGVSSYDFDPVSAEEQQAAVEAIDGNVFWTPYGHVYHTHEDCQALNQTDELTYGTVEQAIESNRTRLCSFCAKRDNITTVTTDDVDTSDMEEIVEETVEEPAA